MKIVFLTLLFISGMFGANANAPEGKVLFTVAGESTSLEEFNYVYNKSNGRQDDAYTEKSLREYLDLYVNFRLKIKEAMELQMDTSKAFKEELAQYRSQAAQPYLTSNETLERLMKEGYDRMQEEVRASHILIRVGPDDLPEDTAKAYKSIQNLRNQIVGGVDFGKVARSNSQDPSAAQNSGDLGYFSAFAMVYPFENRAYNTPVGEVSDIFRTDFGYHFLKVEERRPTKGTVRVAHIMLRATAGMDPEDSLAAKQKIEEIYKELKNGADWGKMVNEYSEDGYSKVKDGELDPLNINSRIVPEFKERALNMKEPGELTEPFQTAYGWHIIKFLKREPVKSYEELEPQLKKWVERDERAKVQKTTLVKRLKLENNFKEYPKNLDWFASQVDSTIFDGKFAAPANNKKYLKNLFTLNKDGFNSMDFLEFLKIRRPKSDISPEFFVKLHYPQFVEESIIQYQEQHLEEKYYDFKMLMNEYHDGILMFNLMEERIWNESTRDTAGLEAFFNDNQENFQWNERAEAWIFDCKNESILKTVDSELERGLFSVSRPLPGTYYYDFRSKDLSENDLNIFLARLKVLISNPDLRAKVIVSSYSKESYGKYSKIGDERIAIIKEKAGELGIPEASVEYVNAGTKNPDPDPEKARKISVTFYSVNPKDLQANLNKTAPLSLNTRTGKFEKGDNEFLDQVEWKEGIYKVSNDDRIVRIKVFGTEDPRAKKLNEVKGEAISAYQDHLEKEWIKELKAKYPVQINEEVFKTLIKANP